MENQDKINLIRQMIEQAQENINQAKEVLAQIEGGNCEISQKINKPNFFSVPQVGKIIEGTFDGERMIDSEGKGYPVPANYASKSKLVEGDLLKLIITQDGSFIYKQIGPIARKRIVGRLVQDENEQCFVLADGKTYQVLFASVTYFKAKSGDEVAILVPREKHSHWAAIENLVSSGKENHNFPEEKKSLEENEEPDDPEEIEDPAKSIKDEWIPDLDEIKKEAPDISPDDLSENPIV